MCFGTLADNASASLRKGTRVIVTGRTETRGYQTDTGEVLIVDTGDLAG